MTGARKVRVPETHQHRPFVLDLLWIKLHRRWTHLQLAEAIGVDRTTVSRWLSGRSEPGESAVRMIGQVKAEIQDSLAR